MSVTNFATSVSRNMEHLSLDSGHSEILAETRKHAPSSVADGLARGLTGLGLGLLGKLRSRDGVKYLICFEQMQGFLF